jgi:hypothetical protein
VKKLKKLIWVDNRIQKSHLASIDISKDVYGRNVYAGKRVHEDGSCDN